MPNLPARTSDQPAEGDSRQDESTGSPFVEALTGCQSRLYAYIFTLTGNAEAAKDVLQETNRALWQKAADYDASRPFQPWAFGFAFQQVRAARKRTLRDRLVLQDDDALEAVSQHWLETHASPSDDRLIALERCVQKLPEANRQLVHRHYTLGETVEEIASDLGKRANTLAVTLYRVREALGKCIKESMANPS